MTFNDYMAANPQAGQSLGLSAPTSFTVLTDHLRRNGLIGDQEKPFDIAASLHQQLGKFHQAVMQDVNADATARRLSHQSMLLSYQMLLVASLLVPQTGKGETKHE